MEGLRRLMSIDKRASATVERTVLNKQQVVVGTLTFLFVKVAETLLLMRRIRDVATSYLLSGWFHFNIEVDSPSRSSHDICVPEPPENGPPATEMTVNMSIFIKTSRNFRGGNILTQNIPIVTER